MIPVIEESLSDLINSRIQFLKDNIDYLPKILGISATRLQRVGEYIQRVPIKVLRGGYPRTGAELPCYCILLSKETESQSTIGDLSNMNEPNMETLTESVPILNSNHRHLLKITNIPISEVIAVTTEDYLEVSYDIVDNDLGLIEVYPMVDGLHEGQNLLVEYTYCKTSTEFVESLYECNYRIEVWTSNGDLTVELYHILKWILMSGRHILEDGDHKVFRQKLGGGDFEPSPNFFPEFVYRRSLTYWCQLIASAPVYDVPYISDISVEESIFSDSTGGDVG